MFFPGYLLLGAVGDARWARALQGEVVPHDTGGEGRQPALQREHHLRAAGVSRVCWNPTCHAWDVPSAGEVGRISPALLPEVHFCPFACKSQHCSISVPHLSITCHRGQWGGRGGWGGGRAIWPCPHQGPLCPSSAPSSTTCWRSASPRSSVATSSRSRRPLAIWMKVGLGGMRCTPPPPPSPGCFGTAQASLSLSPCRAIQAAQRPH